MKMNKSSNGNRPLISFILTCYNLPVRTIQECLDRIMSLSLRPHEREIIMVDDGSDACVINELTGYRDSLIYIRQKSCGLSAARNIGIQMATGTNIQFIDGGDRLVPEVYEMCLDIVRYNNPDIVMFKSSDKETPVAAFHTNEPVDGTKYMLCNRLKTTVNNYIFNRKTLMDLRFNPIMTNNDNEFTPLLLLRAEKVYATDIVAYLYGKDRTSGTDIRNKKHTIRALNDTELIIFRLNELISSIPRREQLALQRYVAQLTMDYIRNIMKLTHSSKLLEDRLERLKTRGLFPLPDRKYTTHYSIFRKFANNRITRGLLTALLR